MGTLGYTSLPGKANDPDRGGRVERKATAQLAKRKPDCAGPEGAHFCFELASLLRSFSKRCLPAGLGRMMEFKRYQGKRFQGWLHTNFQPPASLLENPERVGEYPGAEHLLDCRGRQIYRLPLLFQEGRASCFTYYFQNGSWSRSLRPTSAFRSLRIAEKLRRNRVKTLQVVAALKKRKEWLNWHSFVVAREIEEVQELPSGGNHVYQIHRPASLSPSLVTSLAQELAGFHAKGFFHGDLKTRHVLVQHRSNPGGRFYFVDLEKCISVPYFPGWLRDVLAARDLIQLFASLPDDCPGFAHGESKKLLLQRYLEVAPISRHRRSRLCSMVQLYSAEGEFQQGRTLLSNILRKYFPAILKVPSPRR